MYANLDRADVKTYSIKRHGRNYQLSKNFQLWEFQSKDGHDIVMVHPGLVQACQKLRDLVGGPVNIHSGYRTQSHHKAIYDKMNAERRRAGLEPVAIPWQSAHLFGMAVDVTSPAASIERLAYLMRYEVGMGGVAMYKGSQFVHGDVERVRTWADGVPPKGAGVGNVATGGILASGGLLALAVGGILLYRYIV